MYFVTFFTRLLFKVLLLNNLSIYETSSSLSVDAVEKLNKERGLQLYIVSIFL